MRVALFYLSKLLTSHGFTQVDETKFPYAISCSEYNYSSNPSNGGMAKESSFLTQSSSRGSTKAVPSTFSEDAKTRKQVHVNLDGDLFIH